MNDMSPVARWYIIGVVIVGAVLTSLGLWQLPEHSMWVWLLLFVQAVATYVLKKPEAPQDMRRMVSLALVVGGLGLLAWTLPDVPKQSTWLWLGLAALAATTHILKQKGPTERSSYQISFMVYGFCLVLLGGPATVYVILVAHLLEYSWGDYYEWYVQSFNVANFAISATLAGAVLQWIEPHRSLDHPESTLATLVALGTFTLVNHWLIGMVLRLARGQSFSQSGVFGLLTLTIDFSLLIMGAGMALLFVFSPYAALLGLIPLYLIYSTLRLPALQRQTETDVKTGVYNSGYFAAALQTELDRAHRFDRPLTVVMADLDLLRNINNTYGHLAGDVVLAGIASTLQGLARDYDVVARFGGEEFGILMPETTPEEAWPMVEKMRTAIHGTQFRVSTSITPIRATMSFGVAGRSSSEQSPDALIHCADVALYRAKQSGRNRTTIFGGDGEYMLATGIATHQDVEDSYETASAIRHSAVPSSRNGSSLERSVSADGGSELERSADSASSSSAAPKLPLKAPPRWLNGVYIGLVAIIAGVLLAIFVRPTPDFYWPGLAVIAAAALLTEAMSIEIYLRDTAVSTSAAPLIAGALLFGPTGAAVLAVTTALASFIKNRTAANRLIFNVSNFAIGNMLCVALVSLFGRPTAELSWPLLLLLSMLSALVMYLSTTWLLAGAVSSDTGYKAKAIWMERFRWLVPYYVALGVVAFALLFSYLATGIVGAVVILVPLFMLRVSQKQYIDHTRNMVGQLRATNRELVSQAEEITLLNEELLLTLARSVDLRDPHVLAHSKNVARYASLTAEELGLPADKIELIRKAGLLHDIGKLGIPESILFKPDKLNGSEYRAIKDHVSVGAELIYGCHSLRVLIPFVKYHHEWYDGRGYPDGLAGDEIPLEARILGLADAVEAMASDRPYKKAMTPAEIIAEIAEFAGTQFDPMVATAFERVVARNGESVIVNSARSVRNRKPSGRLDQQVVAWD